ncbi:hypothetical protein TNCV_5104901 [Trichonephila clavipes]|nr:hypothetical protein TNCV_5104901 [Trichonephila clavipes]
MSTNLQFRNQIIPRGMCIGQAEPLNEGHLCVLFPTHQVVDDQQETSESQMNCSPRTNVKHRIFTGDHAPINQRAYRVSPTERRIIHEEVQKMQVSSNPLKVLVITRCARFCYLAEPLQSLLKSGVEFHWGPEEVEAFNSLKKNFDPVWGCTTKELLQKSILMQAGTVSELS